MKRKRWLMTGIVFALSLFLITSTFVPVLADDIPESTVEKTAEVDSATAVEESNDPAPTDVTAPTSEDVPPETVAATQTSNDVPETEPVIDTKESDTQASEKEPALPPAYLRSAPVPVRNDSDAKPPACTKTLTDNLDGTYTLTLSVTGRSQVTSTSRKANVVVCFDSSNSMEDEVEIGVYEESAYGAYGQVNSEYVRLYTVSYSLLTSAGYSGDVYYDDNGSFVLYTGTRYRSFFSRYYSSTTGNYGRINNQYVQLYSAGFAAINDGNTDSDLYYEADNGIYEKYQSDARYTRTGVVNKTRLEAAQESVNALASQLLSNNTSSVPDLVEMAFINYGSLVRSTSSKTTSYAQFFGYVNDVQITNDVYGGTNWEAALAEANAYNWEDTDPVYVIFVTDGNPTFRLSQNGETRDGSRTIGGMTVYGSGNSDNYGANLSAAKIQAEAILNAEKGLYVLGVFGEADKAASLGGEYYEASDTDALSAAFGSIVNSITNQVGYANVQIDDGITSFSSTTILDGEASAFHYQVTDANGHIISVPDLPQATFENGVVSWNLGSEPIISGATYSVSFVVWPSHEAYELIAALNNGAVSYDELTPEQKEQIVWTGSSYDLKTNTFCTVTYQTVTQTIDELTGKVVSEYSEEITSDVDYHVDPLPMSQSSISIKKVWKDSLDPSVLLSMLSEHLSGNDLNFQITVRVFEDGNECTTVDHPDGFVIEPTVEVVNGKVVSASWPSLPLTILPGNMISVDRAEEYGLADANYRQVTYNGEIYYVLSEGHKYTLQEDFSDYRFKTTVSSYCPMLVNGKMKNVVWGNDSNTVSKMYPSGDDELTAFKITNTLKGRIQVTKRLEDPDGNPVDSNTAFYIEGYILDANGNAYTSESRICYQFIDKDGCVSENSLLLGTDSLRFQLRPGESILFLNVPSGARYGFSEASDDISAQSGSAITGVVSANALSDLTVVTVTKPNEEFVPPVSELPDSGSSGFFFPLCFCSMILGIGFIFLIRQVLRRNQNE